MRPTRPWLSVAAIVLATVAIAVSWLDGAGEPLSFFAAAAVVALAQAWTGREPFVGWRRRASIGFALAWIITATWIGALLLQYQFMYGSASQAQPGPEATYLGLAATAYHLVALYVGGLLVTLAAFLPSASPERPTSASRAPDRGR